MVVHDLLALFAHMSHFAKNRHQMHNHFAHYKIMLITNNRKRVIIFLRVKSTECRTHTLIIYIVVLWFCLFDMQTIFFQLLARATNAHWLAYR